MIEEVFELVTGRFETTTPGPDFINLRCFGEDFARWIHSELSAQSVSSSEPIQEDWGWSMIVSFERRKLTISIGIFDESIGRTPANWRIGVGYEKTMNGIRSWFAPPPHATLSKLSDLVEAVLRSNEQIMNLRRTP